MVWFECTDCGESLKKPKVQSHTYSCSASAFNCIDCGRTFDPYSVKEHTTCVTEHDKYAKGATKPGGYAASGFYGNGESAKALNASAPAGLEFLTSRPPWKCNICSVSCTSQETLMGHASGAKHKRRAKAATKQADGQSEAAAGTAATAAPSAAGESAPAELPTQPELEAPKASSAGQPEQSIADSRMKERKRKAEAASVDPEPAASGEAPKDEQTGIKKKEKGKAGGKQDILVNGHSVGNGKPEQDADADGTEATENGNSEAQAVKLKKQKKQKQAAAAESSGTGEPVDAADTPESSKGPKWSKLAKQILESCEGHRLRFSTLQRKLVAAAGMPKDTLAEHRQAIVQKLSSKKKMFDVTDGEVSLKAA